MVAPCPKKVYHTPMTEKVLGTMDALRQMEVGDTVVLCEIERPNIYKLAKRAMRRVRVRRRVDGCFVVTCMGLLSGS